jgi:hypothetical protein
MRIRNVVGLRKRKRKGGGEGEGEADGEAGCMSQSALWFLVILFCANSEKKFGGGTGMSSVPCADAG